MARNTEFRNAGSRFGSTIRQSLDLITGRNVNNYTLLFLDSTKQHKRGESKNIVVPYIVLGRNTSCHVQYGDDYPTVSRQHASIQSDDKGCMLIHNPQATNPTYVDGRPISGYHSLESGDEIQLSQDGPRVRFIIDKTTKTSTIGFTRRMSMAIGQSLRPYKRALIVAGVLLIGVLGYAVWSTLKVSDLNAEQHKLTENIISLVDSLEYLGTKTSKNEGQINSTIQAIENLQKEQERRGGQILFSNAGSSQKTPSKLLESLEKNIYYIHVVDFNLGPELDMFDEVHTLMDRWSGTGFLANDGRFYTARHVVEPWAYPDDACDILSLINNFVARGGKPHLNFIAISPSGDSFPFSYADIVLDKSVDKADGPYDCDGDELSIIAPKGNSTDYAYVQVGNRTSNIQYDRDLSRNLDRGEKLYIHGYPGGLHLQDNYTVDPVYSEALVAQTGFKKGVLYVTSMSIVGGNSGGPVFALRNNKLIVVGIASATYDKVGVIVPASNFR